MEVIIVMKKSIAILCVICVIICMCSCCNDISKQDASIKEIQQTTTQKAEESSSETTDNKSIEIVLVAGEIGDYGTEVIINEDTEFEECVCQYRVPAGTYTVTNKGEYMNQFNIYSIETHITEDGWEEPAEVFFVKLIDVGESKTVTIEDGQYIEIHEPAVFSLKSK